MKKPRQQAGADVEATECETGAESIADARQESIGVVASHAKIGRAALGIYVFFERKPCLMLDRASIPTGKLSQTRV